MPSNKLQIISWPMGALVLLCVAGCASEPKLVSINRLSGTGLNDADRVAVVVTEGESKGAPVWETGSCLKSWMTARNSKIKLVSNDAFKKAVFQERNEGGASAVVQTEDIPKLLYDPEVSMRAKALGIRYLVLSQYFTIIGPGKTSGAIHPGGWAVGTISQRLSTYSADVFDMRGVLLGRLNTTATGESNSGVIFLFWVIPIPIYFASTTETYACSRLGRALADFLLEANGTMCDQNGYAVGSCAYEVKGLGETTIANPQQANSSEVKRKDWSKPQKSGQ